MKNLKIKLGLLGFLATLFVSVLLVSCEQNAINTTSHIGNLEHLNITVLDEVENKDLTYTTKELTIKNGEYETTIRVKSQQSDVLNQYDETSFRLVLIKDKASNHNHDNEEMTLDRTLIDQLKTQLPEIEVLETSLSEEEYFIEWTKPLDVLLPDSNVRGCTWSNGVCLYHGGCWRSVYTCSCGGRHYSTCDFGSPWHWHNY